MDRIDRWFLRESQALRTPCCRLLFPRLTMPGTSPAACSSYLCKLAVIWVQLLDVEVNILLKYRVRAWFDEAVPDLSRRLQIGQELSMVCAPCTGIELNNLTHHQLLWLWYEHHLPRPKQRGASHMSSQLHSRHRASLANDRPPPVASVNSTVALAPEQSSFGTACTAFALLASHRSGFSTSRPACMTSKMKGVQQNNVACRLAHNCVKCCTRQCGETAWARTCYTLMDNP